MNADPFTFAAVIVAAGTSARLGQPKQLLTISGQTLIARAADASIRAGASPVVVVLGAYENRVRIELANLPVVIVSNPKWADGMGSSIRCGVTQLIERKQNLDAILVAVCDQPHFQADTITALRTAFRGQGSIVAARYAGRDGVPVLFGRDYFGALAALHGDKGARQILNENSAHVIGVDLPELATDVDTWEDYKKLTNSAPT